MEELTQLLPVRSFFLPQLCWIKCNRLCCSTGTTHGTATEVLVWFATMLACSSFKMNAGCQPLIIMRFFLHWTTSRFLRLLEKPKEELLFSTSTVERSVRSEQQFHLLDRHVPSCFSLILTVNPGRVWWACPLPLHLFYCLSYAGSLFLCDKSPLKHVWS